MNRFFPWLELNWYALHGATARQPGPNCSTFDGVDLYNFGANHVAGLNELVLNLGGRVKITDYWQVGVVGGFSVLGGSRQMDNIRLTFDMIFRF